MQRRLGYTTLTLIRREIQLTALEIYEVLVMKGHGLVIHKSKTKFDIRNYSRREDQGRVKDVVID
jgi:hypothetical protein